MLEPRAATSKRPRSKYSRLICLGCSERRIRCELPRDVAEVETLDQGELLAIQTPCYRCSRRGVPCVVRKTVLGRPSHTGSSSRRRNGTTGTDSPVLSKADDIAADVVVELPLRIVAPAQSDTTHDEAQPVDDCDRIALRPLAGLLQNQRDSARYEKNPLLTHSPESAETILILRAIDTLRCQRAEEEWYRHLSTHVGHTPALDLSIKAMVVACAYNRRVPKLTPQHCYKALALAIRAVQVAVKQSPKEASDDLLSSAALLAPFEGVINQHGIPTRLHVEGVAAVLAARSATYPVTQLARDILDYYAYEAAIVAYIHDSPSSFESVNRAYYASNRVGCVDSDRAQLKALSNELFIRMPRLVKLVRSLRLQPSPQRHILSAALALLASLLYLQDSQAEERILQTIELQPSTEQPLLAGQSLRFTCVRDFEALVGYWQNRLALLRLQWWLQTLLTASNGIEVETDRIDEAEQRLWQSLGPNTNEASRLMEKVLTCSEYARTLPLRRHTHLFVYAMITLWGAATQDVEAARSLHHDGEWMGCLSELILRRSNSALSAKPELSIEDLDTAADIFAGGVPRGRLAELYGL